jgi:hypothetical protein
MLIKETNSGNLRFEFALSKSNFSNQARKAMGGRNTRCRDPKLGIPKDFETEEHDKAGEHISSVSDAAFRSTGAAVEMRAYTEPLGTCHSKNPERSRMIQTC